jgi:hypothetical protein
MKQNLGTTDSPSLSVEEFEAARLIAERFIEGYMHPGLEHDAEVLARAFRALCAAESPSEPA